MPMQQQLQQQQRQQQDWEQQQGRLASAPANSFLANLRRQEEVGLEDKAEEEEQEEEVSALRFAGNAC